MSEVEYILDEYVSGTPSEQARYVFTYRTNMVHLNTVLESELAGHLYKTSSDVSEIIISRMVLYLQGEAFVCVMSKS